MHTGECLRQTELSYALVCAQAATKIAAATARKELEAADKTTPDDLDDEENPDEGGQRAREKAAGLLDDDRMDVDEEAALALLWDDGDDLPLLSAKTKTLTDKFPDLAQYATDLDHQATRFSEGTWEGLCQCIHPLPALRLGFGDVNNVCCPCNVQPRWRWCAGC